MKDIIAISRGGVAYYNIERKMLFFHGFILIYGGYNDIEVFIQKNGEKIFLGKPDIHVERKDVYDNYTEYGQKDTGFRFVKNDIDICWSDKIEILVFGNDNVKRSKSIKITPAFYGYTERKVKFLSFAQYLEDLILWHVLSGVVKNNGIYIDVGANDPWYNSVTKIFYLSGMRGINIEPLTDKYTYLCFDRPKDININCGIYSSEGQMELYSAGGAKHI